MIKEKDEKMWTEEFEKDGEAKVELNLLSGGYGNSDDHSYPKAVFAKIWLERKKIQKEESIKNQEIGFIQESNEIAKDSNKIANSAKCAAWWALGLAAVSTVVSLIALFK